MELKNEEEMELKNRNITVYHFMPEGWEKLKGATTAPKGYCWIRNRKSRFRSEYKHGLLKL